MYNLDVSSTKIGRLILSGLCACAVLCLTQSAHAADRLRELSGTPFYTETHPWLEASSLDEQDQSSFAAAELLGQRVVNISGIGLTWPKSKRRCAILAGQYGDMRNSDGEALATSICVSVSDGAMQIVNLNGERTPGFLSKLAVWPDSRSPEARLLVLASFSGGYEDSSVLGFCINPDGSISRLDTGNAHTQWGEFQVADLDDNGSYELLCYRNLDGRLGGLSYRSVRGFDAANDSYKPAAEQHLRFFELQLDWLDWVIRTRDMIVANPAQYFSEQGQGNFYTAEYNSERYGFDTIIFIDNPDFSREQSTLAQTDSREAFRRVKQYRDELAGWLNGGPLPGTWGLP